MEAPFDDEPLNLAGGEVDLVLYDADHARLVRTVVACSSPLCLRADASADPGLGRARQVMLLTRHHGLSMRGNGYLDRVKREDDEILLVVANVFWSSMERRRHVRVPMRVPVSLKLVVEGEAEPGIETVHGHTLDMSITGALVHTAQVLPERTLVEFSGEIGADRIRALAVVAHVTRDRRGMGLHFVDYLDNSRDLIRKHLPEAV